MDYRNKKVMNILKLIDIFGIEKSQDRNIEQKVLQEIAMITSREFAEQASNELDSEKHPYNFKVYLELLSRVKRLLLVGMPEHFTLE